MDHHHLTWQASDEHVKVDSQLALGERLCRSRGDSRVLYFAYGVSSFPLSFRSGFGFRRAKQKGSNKLDAATGLPVRSPVAAFERKDGGVESQISTKRAEKQGSTAQLGGEGPWAPRHMASSSSWGQSSTIPRSSFRYVRMHPG
ncbi:hypothetical protein AXG93_2490s1270 [Marchantia polymorpha subsp. ruderalis]|uniref:Uncharacterized protein n=1 Tax=Marchantia polymorpha subsp. ruderalis TaxID=1480154 RepID=A0A176W852_MARPO|nr:hypothetical protein AXG93_2490s1270 [Marchantia polymorpha subsp. ruderalis]